MTRVLVFSDSHGKVDEMTHVINTVHDIQAIIHLGDIYKDVLYLENMYPNIPIHLVMGNNDVNFPFDSEKLIEIDGIKIFMTHGHHYNVNMSVDRLLSALKAKNAAVILYGHTHISDYQECDGKIVANPGSISAPKSGQCSYGVLEIEDGEILGYSNIEINEPLIHL